MMWPGDEQYRSLEAFNYPSHDFDLIDEPMPWHMEQMMYDSAEWPPTHEGKDEASRLPPEYSCSILLTAPLLLKSEYDAPSVPSLVRGWQTVNAVLRGPMLEFRRKGRIVKFSLQAGEVGLAPDYRRRSNVIRVRAEGFQFLLATSSLAESIRWVVGITTGIAISLPIEERDVQIPKTTPPRRPYTPSIEPWDEFRREWREVRRRSSSEQIWLRGPPASGNSCDRSCMQGALSHAKFLLTAEIFPWTKSRCPVNSGSFDLHKEARRVVEIRTSIQYQDEHSTRESPKEASDKDDDMAKKMASSTAVAAELDYARRCAPILLYASPWKSLWYYHDGSRVLIQQ